jgi:cytochrome c-type biogenesis protein CcmH
LKRLAVAAAAVLALAAPAVASAACPSRADLEDELVCPTCKTTLDQSDAPVARRMKAYVADRVRACASKQEIKDELVAQFGRGVLAEPPRSGFDLLAWALPVGGVLMAALAVGALAWRWTRARDDLDGPEPELDPELERRVDAELARFDR